MHRKWLALLLFVYLCSSSITTCWRGDSDCNSKCPTGFEHNFDTIIYIGPFCRQFANSMQKAEAIMKENGAVHSLDPPSMLHTTINCTLFLPIHWIDFCCYNKTQQEQILDILFHLKWKPFYLTFKKVQCNLATSNIVSLYALVDEQGQALLWNLTRRIENAIVRAGIPINHPREQAFHSTLGQVLPDYPADQVVSLLNQTFPVFNPTEPFFVNFFHCGSRICKATLTDDAPEV